MITKPKRGQPVKPEHEKKVKRLTIRLSQDNAVLMNSIDNKQGFINVLLDNYRSSGSRKKIK